jgi:hypothetical protein
MDEKQTDLRENRLEITSGGHSFVVIWAVCLLILYVAGAFLGAVKLRGYAAESEKSRQVRIASPTMDLNAKAPNLTLPSKAKSVDVLVGGSINRIGEFVLREATMTADFNLWFRWNSDAVNPGKGFRLVNGQILQQENVESSRNGKEHYVEYRIVARMTEDFDASRFPFGENGMVIQVEDNTPGAITMRYIADKKGSSTNPEAIPRGLKLTRFLVDAKIGIHKSGRINPNQSDNESVARSQLVLAMLVVPDGIGLYQKFFQALFASVAVALIALYIKPIHLDCRFGLPVGGFFAAVGNNIFVGTLLPNADRLTLSDMVNATGLLTIFFILVQSVISLHIYDTMGNERLSRFFDRVSFAVFLIGYVAVNLALPISARPL